MAPTRKSRVQIELVGGPMDGAVYMCKKLPKILELSELILLDPASDLIQSTGSPSFYRKEKFLDNQWLYLFAGHNPE